jgi:hypothetical protein
MKNVENPPPWGIKIRVFIIHRLIIYPSNAQLSLSSCIQPFHYPEYPPSSVHALYLSRKPALHSPQSSTFLQLGLLSHRPNLQLRRVLLQHALVVIFPELLGSVLAGDSLEDLGSAGMLVYEVCFGILVSESKDVGGWNFGEQRLKARKSIEVCRARARQVEW